jgi:quinolinate synthase
MPSLVSITKRVVEVDRSMQSSGIRLTPGMNICQTDLPIDWYQNELKSYAEEYLALPDRKPETVLPWMDSYILPALQKLDVVLLAHYYMGGEIVKLVERYGGKIADSYELAKVALNNPDKKLFVESAVHFMAETIALLKHDDQSVFITNPKSGCTMEALAKEDMVLPLFDELVERYGEKLLVVCYMNTSGRFKALAGKTGGAVCTSSNAAVIMKWARDQGKKISFVPDEHLGRNSGKKVGIPQEKMFLWKGGYDGANMSLADVKDKVDASELVLWGSFCGVHMVFKVPQIEYWRQQGYKVFVHPECTIDVVDAADGSGSTNYLWKAVLDAKPGDKLAIGTEGHFVRNARDVGKQRGVDVVNLADVPAHVKGAASLGCGCATMSRNDPPHLVGVLDLLAKGRVPEMNRVLPGDVVDESTGARERLDAASQAEIARDARKALEKMIELTEASRSS